MSLDELKDKYKSLPIWARLLMALIIGILPGACSYLDEVDTIEAQLVEAQEKETTARGKFEENRQKKSNIPKLEEELAYTEDQLVKAKKNLPEGYLIENILSLTATNAKAAGTVLVQFTPKCELQGQAEFKYVERTIDVEMTGKFQQIASFFDRMVHSESMIFIRAIEMRGQPNSIAENSSVADQTPFQMAELSRRNFILNAKFQVVVFRAMKDEEIPMFENKTSCEATGDFAQQFAQPPAPIAPLPDGATPGGEAPPPPGGGH